MRESGGGLGFLVFVTGLVLLLAGQSWFTGAATVGWICLAVTVGPLLIFLAVLAIAAIIAVLAALFD